MDQAALGFLLFPLRQGVLWLVETRGDGDGDPRSPQTTAWGGWVNKADRTGGKQERDRQMSRGEKREKEKLSHANNGQNTLLGCPGNYSLCPLVLSGLILMQILFLSTAPFI